jgi:hypothetical protein
MPKVVGAGSGVKCYGVADLVLPIPGCGPAKAGPSTDELLVALIPRLIAPGSWVSQGGWGAIDYHPLTMALVVNQTPAVQEQIAHFLDVLRQLQPREFTVETRLGKVGGEAKPLPKLTLFDGQTARVVCSETKAGGGAAKGSFAFEARVLSIDQGRLGLSLDLQIVRGDHKVEHMRTIRTVKAGEAVKVPLGAAAPDEPQEWFEVLVKRLPEAEEAVKAAPAEPMGCTLPAGPYLEHNPQYVPPTCSRAETKAVVPARHVVKDKTWPKATATLKLPGGAELSVRTAGGRVIVKSPKVEVWADHLVFDHNDDSILLEGHVRLKSGKAGDGGGLYAERVRLQSDGLIDINPEVKAPPTTNCAPACSLSGAPMPSFGMSPPTSCTSH